MRSPFLAGPQACEKFPRVQPNPIAWNVLFDILFEMSADFDLPIMQSILPEIESAGEEIPFFRN
jgi:hypothetical protein